MTAGGTGLLPELRAPGDSAHSRLLDKAIKAGKFSEARRGHYAALLARDPSGTKRLIAKLTPVAAIPRRCEAHGTGLLRELPR